MRSLPKILSLGVLWMSVAAGCGGPSDEPPGPLGKHLDDMYIAQIPLDQKQSVVQTQNDWSLAKMENAKADADLNEANAQLSVVRAFSGISGGRPRFHLRGPDSAVDKGPRKETSASSGSFLSTTSSITMVGDHAASSSRFHARPSAQRLSRNSSARRLTSGIAIESLKIAAPPIGADGQ